LRGVLKQRLVGALVLIALGVVFWPLVFVDSDRQTLDRTSQVPPMPNLQRLKVKAPRPLQDAASQTNEIPLHTQLPEQAPQTSPGTRPEPHLDKAGIPVAWVLQVITVSKQDKADELVRELVALGYKAYQRPLKREQKTLYRVNIGPVFDPQKLQSTKQAMDKRLRVNAIIARYIP